MNKQPKIILSSSDYGRLDDLLGSLPDDAFAGKDALEKELERAEVVEPDQVPPNVVTMNSTARFAIEGSDEEFCLTLVYPHGIDGSSDKISILAPVGSALLGLSEGDKLQWPRPGGGTMTVRVVEVTYQPERAGEFHR